MEWQDFLKHPDVKGLPDIQQTPPGKYLYRKIAHDVLECLNMYKACAAHAAKLNSIPLATRSWLAKNLAFIEAWIEHVTIRWKQLETGNQRSENWPVVIGELVKFADELTPIIGDVSGLALPENVETNTFAVPAIKNLQRLSVICRDVTNQDYLNMWQSRRLGVGSV